MATERDPREAADRGGQIADSRSGARVSTSQLLALLGTEISRLERRDTVRGWTPWAIGGALATTLLLLSNDLEKPGLHLHGVLFCLVALALAHDAIWCLQTFVDWSPPAVVRRPRFVRPEPKRRRSLLLDGLRAAFLAAVSWKLMYRMPTVSVGASIAFFGAWAGIYGFLFVHSYRPWPRPVGSTGTSRVDLLVVASLTLLAFVAIAGISIRSWMAPGIPAVPEWRVAALLLISYALSRRLADSGHPESLVSTLEGLHRDISLGNLEAETAKRHIEIALLGLEAKDVVKSDVTYVMSRVREAASVVERIIGIYAELGPQIARPVTEVPGQQLRAIASTYRSAGALYSRAISLIRELPRFVKERLGPKLGIVSVHAADEPEVAALSTALGEEIDRLTKKLEEAHAAGEQIGDWLSGHLPDSEVQSMGREDGR